MLEILMAIKNNNVSKIPNYNPEFVENLRKSLKIFIRKGNYSTELKISLQDLLNGQYYKNIIKNQIIFFQYFSLLKYTTNAFMA